MASGRVLLRTRAAVVLTAAVALLSVITGIVNIADATVSGPLAPYIPEYLEQTAGFTGALTGFLMLGSAFGLRRGLRAAWYSAVVLLPLTAFQGLVQSNVVSYPLVGLSILALPALLINYQRFDAPVKLSTTQLAAAAALVGTQIYGTVGAYTLREHFVTVTTLTDAFYYTLVTASTVGYGDAIPANGAGPGPQQARLFAMSVVVLGTASFAVALGSLLGPAIEARLATALGTMTDRQLELLEDHVVVLGYGDLSEPILEELAASNVPFVVITPDAEAVTRLRARDIDAVTADPSDEEPLQRAGIDRARAAVAATNDDAADALSILTANALRPDIRIVAAATERENVEKLRRAGADTVISPAVIGGHLLVESALGADDTESIADGLLEEDHQADESTRG
jgi:voltage-gated potassium channel